MPLICGFKPNIIVIQFICYSKSSSEFVSVWVGAMSMLEYWSQLSLLRCIGRCAKVSPTISLSFCGISVLSLSPIPLANSYSLWICWSCFPMEFDPRVFHWFAKVTMVHHIETDVRIGWERKSESIRFPH